MTRYRQAPKANAVNDFNPIKLRAFRSTSEIRDLKSAIETGDFESRSGYRATWLSIELRPK
jgi:hypothetical protein